jgi:hypothetical protein
MEIILQLSWRVRFIFSLATPIVDKPEGKLFIYQLAKDKLLNSNFVLCLIALNLTCLNDKKPMVHGLF